MSTKTKAQSPPYLPYKTFSTTLAGWATALPARIDRTLFRSFSGAMQSWLIGTLRYFELIDPEGHPTDKLKRLVVATEGPERQKLIADLVRRGYPFVFANDLDLSKATAGQLQDRFKDAGLQGDTVRKAMALFMALAKDAGMQLSPYLKMPRQRRSNGPAQRAVPTKTPRAASPEKQPAVPPAGDSMTMKVVSLPKAGGTLTVGGTFKMFDLEGSERDLVFQIIDLMKEFEATGAVKT
jgi:hypothetical protein